MVEQRIRDAEEALAMMRRPALSGLQAKSVASGRTRTVHEEAMTTPHRAYYSQRTGKNTGKPKMSLEQARRMFSARFSGFEDEGFFQEHFGKPCPDNRSPGTFGETLRARSCCA